jgi:hypothetical protein
MESPMHTDHLLRRAFADPALVPLWLRFLLRDHPLCARIAWSTLQVAPGASVDPKLRRHEADLVLKAQLKESLREVVFVIEFSLGRKRAAWRQLVRYCAQEIEKAQRKEPGMPVPLVVPVLVHAGRRPFEGLLAVTAQPIDGAAGRDQAGFSFAIALDDFAARTEDEIKAMPVPLALKLAALFAKFVKGRTPDEVEAALLRWNGMLREACGGASDPEAAQVYATYVLETTQMPQERFERVLNEILGPDGDGPMKTTADLLREEGRAEGEARGEARGQTRGRTEGRTEVLLTLLRRRFGELPSPLVVRLASSTIAQLDAIALRILDAKSLDEVFGS